MFRDLLLRDLRGRFVGSRSGWLWVVLTPLLLLAVYGFVFGVIFRARVPAGLDLPFVAWLAIAMWPWLAFQDAILRAAASMPEHANLISKVPLARDQLALSAATAAFVLQVAGFVAVLVALPLFGVAIAPQGLAAALLTLAVLFALAAGLGFFAAALRVFYRDLDQLLPTLLMFAFFLTPILYAPEMLPDHLQSLWMFNPVAGLMNDLRAALLHGQVLPGAHTLWMVPVSALVFLVGRAFFRRLAPYFEDYL
ncbi:ABC transporter permease [Wenzhouxiangella sp. XN79A]|uniref:ABC transporter permease n=1 Tax=Wenzhouxiangella sp. XN79A TaxID=2724193 RepID=UPI00144AC574|nr:ABC transporter permease [Wenzhouxiangella sp. XN79A]NKI35084.1 ABC transporter permease [Wenzhouxiangella sp. XN79A]